MGEIRKAQANGTATETVAQFLEPTKAIEELYDTDNDPHELNNLASDPEYAKIIRQHRRWLPEKSARPAPGSRSRILIYENGKANWEGSDILPDEPIPEI
jgi:hypothetical protein